MRAIDLDELKEDLEDRCQPEGMVALLYIDSLIAELEQLRKIVLAQHRRGGDYCVLCDGVDGLGGWDDFGGNATWPCPSAQAAGAE